ncbi:hypothetical protein [Saccharothrix sp. NRRL B-16314]|uniref:hypothetical protein n=1 Tax=Saccharothrix sp. NRRL B-16314 TaxID=1463825 RepID=UPI000525773D|nr:hypothetical protein [Saccharothrix sp. NRRL B-16314]
MVVRVRGVEDAKRMREELRDERHGSGAVTPVIAPPTGAGAARVVAEGGDRIEVDLDEFTRAESRLAELHGTLSELLGRAGGELGQPLGDGRGPVARHMRQAFGLRAGDQDAGDVGGGVQTALRSYLKELERLRDALHQVGVTHRAEDEQVAEELRRL